MKKSLRKFVAGALSVGLLLLLWQVIAWSVGKPELIPTVPRLVGAFIELAGSEHFLRSVGTTVMRGLVGMVLSLVVAAGVAVVLSRKAWMEELFRPLFVVMRSVPVISFILLALIFLRPESIPLLIAFLTMFPLLCENLTKGLKNLRPEAEVLAQTFRLQRVNYYTQVLYPQLQPFLFSGLASAAGFGWRAIIMGEVLSQCAFGIGSEMKRAQVFIDVPSLLGWTVVAVAVSFAFDKGLERLGGRRFPIRYRQHGETSENVEAAVHVLPVTLKNVSKSYGATEVLRDFSFTFEPGKIYGISAPSGTGKSTLLHLIDGSLPPTSGTVTADRRRGIACMFQEPELLPGLTVRENIQLPLSSLHSHKEAERLADRFLTFTEMDAFACRLPHELSYGQQQRVALARALAFPAPILLLDEPFKGLDEALTVRLIHQLRNLHQHSEQILIFVTHKPEELSLLADIQLKLH